MTPRPCGSRLSDPHALRRDVASIGAKGFDPMRHTPRIIIPDVMVRALSQIA